MLGTLDSALTYGTAALREVFSDKGFVDAFLKVELALLQAQEELGFVPSGESQKLARLRGFELNVIAATEQALVTGNPVADLVEQLYRVTPYAHFGITANDAWDVAHVLQLKTATRLILQDACQTIEKLMHLAEAYADTPMVARTQGQAGAPTTLGFKLATWLDELLRVTDRVRAAMEEASLVSVAGVVGTASSFAVIGASPEAIEIAVARALGLRTSATPWFTSRDRFVALSSALSQLCTLAGKVGHEIYNLQRTGIDELAEGEAFGSSATPHKANPWISQKMHGLATIGRSLSSLVNDAAALPEGEREIGTTYAEWYGLAHLCLVSGRMITDLAKLISHVEVHDRMMRANLEADPAILSESLSMLLSRKVGKAHGHELMKNAVAQYRSGRPYMQAVADAFRQAGVTAPINVSELPGVLGWAIPRVHRIVARARDWLVLNSASSTNAP